VQTVLRAAEVRTDEASRATAAGGRARRDGSGFRRRAARRIGLSMTRLVAPVLSLALAACAPAVPLPTEGELSVLTYNVAGLPQGLSGSNPVEYIPQISPLLNDYDLVLVQEDFAYQAELRQDVTLPYQSFPKEDVELFVGDGLNRFSSYWFAPELAREDWTACNGVDGNANDCLSEKGFSFTPLRLSPETFLHVYNLHMDAGGSDEDHAARMEGVDQLLAFLDEHSAGQPLLIAGDYNLNYGREGDELDEIVLDRLRDEAGLEDACFTLDCDEPWRIDRVLLRSGGGVTVEPTSWSVEEHFVTDDGEALSDHDAVRVDVRWSRE
jgi:hypothetical protein